jgi:hypothetical protein
MKGTGLPGFLDDPVILHSIQCVYFLVLGLFSTTLSGLVLYILLTKRSLRNSNIDLQLIFLLLIFDWLSAFDLVLEGILNVPGLELITANEALCTATAGISNVTFMISIVLVSILSLERCILVVFDVRVKSFIYWLLFLIILATLISLSILAIVKNQIKVQYGLTYCWITVETSLGKLISLIDLIIIAFSQLMITVCYIMIVISRRLSSQALLRDMGVQRQKIMKQVNQTTIRSLIIIIASVICNLPYICLQLIKLIDYSIIHPLFELTALALLCLNSVFNVLILLFIQESLSTELKRFLIKHVPILARCLDRDQRRESIELN